MILSSMIDQKLIGLILKILELLSGYTSKLAIKSLNP